MENGGEGAVNLERELNLCAKLLEHDERNFHCWRYRRFVARRAGVSPAAELRFTQACVDKNFSNYSAWHQRAWLLPQLLADATAALGDFLPPELEMLHQAVFTEPDDQSAWFYHRWLITVVCDGLVAPAGGADGSGGELHRLPVADAARVLASEEGSMRELIELEPKSKWPRTALAFLLLRRAELAQQAGDQAAAAALRAECTSIYELLQGLDHMHAGFYADQLHHLRAAVPAGVPGASRAGV